MTFEDYLINYRSTSICVEYNETKFKHTSLLHDFTNDKFAFFGFTLKNKINLNDLVFSVDLHQQGNRLGSYRKNAPADQKFDPSQYSVMIMNDEGNLVKGEWGGYYEF